jgi:uncharacterized protein YndB with AHSA1/START domain
MADASVIHDTFVIERSYPQAPPRVFAAFADPRKKRRWWASGEGGEEGGEFEMDFRPGGIELRRWRMGPHTPFPGVELVSEGRHLEIAPGRRVVIAAAMTLGGRTISASLATFELAAREDGGTDLTFTHQAAFFEGADGPKLRAHGWRDLLDRLGGTLAEAPVAG